MPKTRQSSRSRELHALERGAVHAVAAAHLMETIRVPGEYLATDTAEIDPASLREHQLTVPLPLAASAASAARPHEAPAAGGSRSVADPSRPAGRRPVPLAGSFGSLQKRERARPGRGLPGKLGPRPLESRL